MASLGGGGRGGAVAGGLPRRRPRILLGLTGSVATVKWQELCCALMLLRVADPAASAASAAADTDGGGGGGGGTALPASSSIDDATADIARFCDVRIIATESARHFVGLAPAYNSAADAQLHALLSAGAGSSVAGIGAVAGDASAAKAPAAPADAACANADGARAPAVLAGAEGVVAGAARAPAAPASAAADTGEPLQPPWTSLLFTDADEWRGYASVGADPVLHIELRRWADVLVVAPLSANSLAKLAHGLADNLLTSTARCWEFAAEEEGRAAGEAGGEAAPAADVAVAAVQGAAAASGAAAGPPKHWPLKPVVVAPAMNTAMWAHPLTRPQVDVLRGLGFTIVPPVSKRLACGDVGVGAMAACADIVAAVRRALRECANAREFL